MQKLKNIWLELVLATLTIAMVVLLLCSCNEYEKLPLKPFNDELYSSLYIQEYGIAVGSSLKVYTIYGKYPVNGKELPPGLCLALEGVTRYPIKELLAKYPDLQSQDALKAAKEQKL